MIRTKTKLTSKDKVISNFISYGKLQILNTDVRCPSGFDQTWLESGCILDNDDVDSSFMIHILIRSHDKVDTFRDRIAGVIRRPSSHLSLLYPVASDASASSSFPSRPTRFVINSGALLASPSGIRLKCEDHLSIVTHLADEPFLLAEWAGVDVF